MRENTSILFTIRRVGTLHWSVHTHTTSAHTHTTDTTDAFMRTRARRVDAVCNYAGTQMHRTQAVGAVAAFRCDLMHATVALMRPIKRQANANPLTCKVMYTYVGGQGFIFKVCAQRRRVCLCKSSSWHRAHSERYML